MRFKEAKALQKKLKKTRWIRKRIAPKKLPKVLQDENNIYDKAVEMYLKDQFKLFEYQSNHPLLSKNDTSSEPDEEKSKPQELDPRSKIIKVSYKEVESETQRFK